MVWGKNSANESREIDSSTFPFKFWHNFSMESIRTNEKIPHPKEKVLRGREVEGGRVKNRQKRDLFQFAGF